MWNKQLWREQQKTKGVCECGNLVEIIGKDRYCKQCRLIRKKGREKRKELSICSCGKKTIDNHVRCKECLKKYADRNMEKKAILLADGICIYCKKEKTIEGGKSQVCPNCSLKHRSIDLWDTIKNWHDLLNLFNKQNGICPYSGLKITIGIDAEIDHIIPRSKNGTHDIENLQWVHSWVNTMKYNKTHQEFIDMIKIINNYITL